MLPGTIVHSNFLDASIPVKVRQSVGHTSVLLPLAPNLVSQMEFVLKCAAKPLHSQKYCLRHLVNLNLRNSEKYFYVHIKYVIKI